MANWGGKINKQINKQINVMDYNTCSEIGINVPTVT